MNVNSNKTNSSEIMMKKYWIQSIALLGVLAFSSSASAQDDYSYFNSKFRVYLGGFWPEITSEIAINGDVLPPKPPANVEDALGIEDNQGVGWGGIGWQFTRRHSVEFEHFSLKRNGGITDVFSPPIEVGDFFIESGTIGTSYDTQLSRITYGFSVIRKERMDLKLKVGIHVAKLEAGIQLSGDICGPATNPSTPPGCPPAGTAAASEDVTAPLPHFGASFAYAFSPTFAMSLQAVGFAIEIDSIDGSILELDANLDWHPWQNIGLGLGLRYFNTNVKAGNSELNGEFDFEYFGPVAYVTARF